MNPLSVSCLLTFDVLDWCCGVVVWCCRQGSGAPSAVLSAKYSEYASLLAAQGSLHSALEYLRLAQQSSGGGGSGRQLDEQSALLFDRISVAAQPSAIIQAQLAERERVAQAEKARVAAQAAWEEQERQRQV
jgi:hypothetical protein